MDTTPTKKEMIKIVEAQTETIDSISKKLVDLEGRVSKQDSKNQNIIIGVLVAVVLIVVTVAIQIILSTKHDESFYNDLKNEVFKQEIKIKDIENTQKNFKILNPYLK
jgi:hypothetical protein